MAEVRLGLDVQLGRAVAIKQLSPELAADPIARARFQHEAWSAASLHHPGIVAVFDTGEEMDLDTGHPTPYIVMELVEGQTLGSMLRRGEKITVPQALTVTRGLLAALAYSHQAGVVHQDIKPGNVMLTTSGAVKLLDFGIARTATDPSGASDSATMVLGTAKYLSPEQARGEVTDVRSDIYSVGCLMYELLVGRPPFVGESVTAITDQHLCTAPAPPSQHVNSVGPDINAIVLTALAKAPGDRYQSADDMRAALDAVQPDDARVAAPAPAVATAPSKSRVRVAAVSAASARLGAAAAPRRALPASATESRRHPVATPGASRRRRRTALVTSALVAVLFPLGGLGLYNASRAANQAEANAATVLELPPVDSGARSATTKAPSRASTTPDVAAERVLPDAQAEETRGPNGAGEAARGLADGQPAGDYAQVAGRVGNEGSANATGMPRTPATNVVGVNRTADQKRSVAPDEGAPVPLTRRPAASPSAGVGTAVPSLAPPKPRAVTPSRPPSAPPARPAKPTRSVKPVQPVKPASPANTPSPRAQPRPSSSPRPTTRPARQPVTEPRSRRDARHGEHQAERRGERKAERATAHATRKEARREARQQRRVEREAARRQEERDPRQRRAKTDKPHHREKADRSEPGRTGKPDRPRNPKADQPEADEQHKDKQKKRKAHKGGKSQG